jgi:hypothetical protein
MKKSQRSEVHRALENHGGEKLKIQLVILRISSPTTYNLLRQMLAHAQLMDGYSKASTKLCCMLIDKSFQIMSLIVAEHFYIPVVINYLTSEY